MLLALFSVASWGDELTVHDYTATKNRVPINVFYFDDFTKSQVVFPAEELGEMIGAYINSITFYTTSSNIPYTAISSADIFLKEVDYTTISAFEDIATGTTVFTGYLDFVQDGSGGKVTIVFNNPYLYNGGNLLIGTQNTEDNGYISIYYYGEVVTGASIYGSSGTSLDDVTSVTQADFLPKTTFDYTPNPTGVPVPTNFRATDIKYNRVSLFWEGSEGLKYNVYTRKAGVEEWTMNAGQMETTGLTVNFLEPSTTYEAAVEAVDDEGNTSIRRIITFTTTPRWPAPTNLTATLTMGDGSKALLEWTENGEAENWEIAVEEIATHLFTATTTSYELQGLTPETTYHAKVRSVSGDEHSEWSETVEFTPSDKYFITVNEGTGTNKYVPVYGYYVEKLTKSQFIIPAENLSNMLYGNIQELVFYSQQQNIDWKKSDGTLPQFKVYLAEVDETSFSGTSATLYDWANMTNVYEGTLAIVDYQMVVTFDYPYQYMGGNLLVGFEQTVSANFKDCYWKGVSTGEDISPAIGGYGTSVNFMHFLPQTTFNFQPGEKPACLTPTNLAVTYEAGRTALVSWTSDEPAFDLMVNQEIIENVTNPYVLEDLEFGTTYTVQVCAHNNSGTSEWSKPATFTTDLSETMCFVTIELNDEYGDGWNGNAIQVMTSDGFFLGEATLTSGSTGSVDIKVPDGFDINFVWVKGNYPGECSFVITSPTGGIIADIDKSTAGEYTSGHLIAEYNVECTVSTCTAPVDLAATVTDISAEVSWEGWADNYNVRYRPATNINPDDFQQVGEDVTTTGEYVAYTFDLSQYAGQMGHIAIRHYNCENQFALCIDDIGLEINNEQVFLEDFENGMPQGWINNDYDGDGQKWIYYPLASADSQGNSLAHSPQNLVYSFSYSNDVGPLTPDNWLVTPYINLGGTLTVWARAMDPDYADEVFGVFVNTEEITASPWTTVNDVAGASYVIEGLTPFTNYEFQVQSAECEDAKWSTPYAFTTLGGVFIKEGDWNVASNWNTNELPHPKSTVAINAPVTVPSGYVAEAKEIILNENAYITIKDGGELISSTEELFVTLEKEVTAGKNYLLSSFSEDEPSVENGLLAEGSNFYNFDPSFEKEWRVFNDDNQFYINPGYGFFYGNSNDITLAFAGSALSSDGAKVEQIQLAESEAPFNAWRIIGNPYTCTAYLFYVDNQSNLLDATFYKLNDEGWTAYDNIVTLAPGEGAFLEASVSGYIVYVTYNPFDTTVEAKEATAVMPLLPKLGLNIDQDANAQETTVPTGIVNVNSDANGDWFSVDGKKLNERPKAKGLYIRNGQKVVVK